MPSEPRERRLRRIGQYVGVEIFDATIVSSGSRAASLMRMAGHGVDQHLVPGHIGEFTRHLRADLVPHHHGIALRVGFRDDREQLARPRPRERKNEAEDAFDAGPGHDRNIGCDFLGQAAMHAAADAGIFALRILPHDDPIELRAGDVTQRADDSGQYARGTNVGVLIERLADRQPQTPKWLTWSGTSKARPPRRNRWRRAP